MIRVAIDPNIVSRLDPSLTVAELSDADGPVSEGDKVTVVQEGDPDFVGTGRVVRITEEYNPLYNKEYSLLYIEVDWNSFQ